MLQNAVAKKTIAVHYGKDEAHVAFLWYSKCKVMLCDVMAEVAVSADLSRATVTLNAETLALYVLTSEQVVAALAQQGYAATLSKVRNVMIVPDPPANLSVLNLRGEALPFLSKDFAIHDLQRCVYTVFKGDLYKHIALWCDLCLSTSTSLNIAYMGKLNAAKAYSEHLSGDNVEFYIPLLLNGFDGPKGYDFESMAFNDPLKAMTTKDQVKALYKACAERRTDALDSLESRVIAGARLV